MRLILGRVSPLTILLFSTLLKPTVGMDSESTNTLAKTHAHLREHPSSRNFSSEQESPLDHGLWIIVVSCLFSLCPRTVHSMRTTPVPVHLLRYS